MKRLALFALALSSLTACESPSAPTPQAPSIRAPSSALLSNTQTSIAFNLVTPCAPAEVVAITGSVHRVVTGEITPTSASIKFHLNNQGVSGVGLTSGDRYSVLQNFSQSTNVTFPPLTGSIDVDNRFRIIRQGSNDNLWLRQTFRITFNPFSVTLIRSEFECRG